MEVTYAQLPNDPGDLIRLALADLEAAESQPEKYTVDMFYWAFKHNDTCFVCLAGSVIVGTLDKAPKYGYSEIMPTWFPEPVGDKLRWINDVRGYIESNIIAYEDSPEDFKSELRKLAKQYDRGEDPVDVEYEWLTDYMREE